MSETIHDVAIIGGGLIGPALALALHGVGFRVAVLDGAPVATRGAPGFDGRAYAVAPASRHLLQAIGVWARIEAHAQPMRDIVVGEGPGSPRLLHFDPRLIGADKNGWMIEDRHLRGALLDALREAGIAQIAPARVERAEAGPGTTQLHLAGGDTVRARLGVVAAGRRPALAAQAGIGRIGWPYRQTGLVNAIEHEHDHQGLAHQSFFPGGPFAVLPLPGRRCQIVWSETAARAKALARLDDTAFAGVLRERIGERLGALRLIGRRWAYPLDLSLAERYCAPRLALAGDAAHGIHPIAGQGMNLGLRDVAALTEVLAEAAGIGEDIGDERVLRRYQRWRRFDAVSFSLAMDALNRLFSNDSSALSALRRAGLAAVQALPGARRTFLREASGEMGEVPKLLRGVPL
ncbi:MAG: UbiH/UbiF/VisC/COQ6 family ubiquinone biosynthesis hydroxylase [Pseudomonadota bacterium]